ncbi:hypothetical protein RP726_05225 [Candidatus Methylospira mobilis]|uniref:hypothetical protein n=1 Tax=Candidatus Methylospira mobilis TaxID=1808979 RepID=UPI0028E1EEFD|nr:hypothetical protein [Candidatus Methylospira mobilis]WNV05820.1 hypothetical protein RP726_05225 [Candidatus Methylospira mobilis]
MKSMNLKTTLSISQAEELRGRFLTLPSDLSTLMTLASDLAHDHAQEPRLSAVHADLAAAYDLLSHARGLILDVWDDAIVSSQDQEGKA